MFFWFQTGMEIIGFPNDEVHNVFKLLSSILKLGNVEFAERINADGTDGCDVVNINGNELIVAKN